MPLLFFKIYNIIGHFKISFFPENQSTKRKFTITKNIIIEKTFGLIRPF